MFDQVEFQKLIVASVLEAFQQMPQFGTVAPAEPATEKKYIYSIKGLAELLNCSVVTAQKLKNKGLIPYRQLGRKLIFDSDAVLNAMHSNKKGAAK